MSGKVIDQATQLEIVAGDAQGLSKKYLAAHTDISRRSVQDVLNRASDSYAANLKKGIRNTLYEVASMGSNEMHRRLAEAPEKIQLPVLTVMTGVAAQRAMELERESQDKLSVDWGKLSSELDPGMEQVTEQIGEAATLPLESKSVPRAVEAFPSVGQVPGKKPSALAS